MALRGRSPHSVGGGLGLSESRNDRKVHIERHLFAMTQKISNLKFPTVLNMDGDIAYQYLASGEAPQDAEIYAMNLIDIGTKISKLFSYGNITKIRITGLHRTLVHIQVLSSEFVLVYFLETEPITRALVEYDVIEDEIGPFVDRLINLLS